MLDFDATLTVVDEIPHLYRAELMESVVDDSWFREKIFGGEDRLEALRTMLKTAWKRGVIPHIVSVSDEPLISKALELAGLSQFFRHRVFGWRDVRAFKEGGKRNLIGQCAQVEGWGPGEILFVDDQESNLKGCGSLCRLMRPADLGL